MIQVESKYDKESWATELHLIRFPFLLCLSYYDISLLDVISYSFLVNMSNLNIEEFNLRLNIFLIKTKIYNDVIGSIENLISQVVRYNGSNL